MKTPFEKLHRSNLRGFEKLTVYKIAVNEGHGGEDDPISRVYYYFDEDGNLLFSTDNEVRELLLEETK